MKKAAWFMVLVLGIIVAMVPLFYQDVFEVQGQTSLKRFTSYEELKSYIEASLKASPSYDDRFMLQPSTSTRTAESNNGQTSSIPDYSRTNIQVEGVDEADILKTDGEFIYIGSGGKIIVLKAYPAEEAEVLSEITLKGTLKGLFVNEDKLAILEEESAYRETFSVKTLIKVYDVSDRESAVLERNVSLDGTYFNSRMIEDYIYAIVNHPAYSYKNEVILPEIHVNDKVEEISASTIYYSNISDRCSTFTTILAVNMQNHEEEPTHETVLLGAASNLYVSLSNIYITFSDTTVEYTMLPLGGAFSNSLSKTSVHRVRIENGEIEYVASGEVPGYVLNQFSMGEYKGYFRIATTTGHVARTWESATSKNHVYVLDIDLKIVGKLENLAPGEKIYSARFLGKRCYLVTFRKVDPLFVIDLRNPFAPSVLGQLKITGYSDYLHPYDESHIIGVGKETVAAEEGDFAWYQGVKISLFDVSDVSNPKEISKYIIGDRGTDSPVLSDHKAFLFDKSKQLLVLPVLVAEIDEDKYPNGVPPNAYGDYVWQGAYVFNITLEGGLVFKGGITHEENYISYRSYSYAVKRTLYIENVLYTISEEKIKMNNLEDLSEINEVKLP